MENIINFDTSPDLSCDLNNNSTTLNSNIILKPKFQKLFKKFKVKIPISEIIDWRLNIFEINKDQNYILLAVKDKIAFIPINIIKLNSNEILGKVRYIMNIRNTINQIKLMKNEKDYFILAVDECGFLHTSKIDYKDGRLYEENYKKFNCKIDSSDNSIWSIDSYYPFIVVGGNHRAILINNIENQDEHEIKNNIVIEGNNHNIPCVTISPDGVFIGCSSIDSFPKIWDMYTGKLVKKLINTKDWAWGIKFINKNDFYISNDIHINEQLLDINCHRILKKILDELESILNNDFKTEPNKIQCEKYYKEHLNNNLNKYIIICSYKMSIFINGFEGENSDQVTYGKFNPLICYLSLKYSNSESFGYNTIVNIQNYIEYSRYEFIFISKCLNKLILGNKQGDIQIYNLEFSIKDNKISFNSKPIAIIEINNRIVGIRVEDYEDDINSYNNYFLIYIVSLNGILECYKFMNI